MFNRTTNSGICTFRTSLRHCSSMASLRHGQISPMLANTSRFEASSLHARINRERERERKSTLDLDPGKSVCKRAIRRVVYGLKPSANKETAKDVARRATRPSFSRFAHPIPSGVIEYTRYSGCRDFPLSPVAGCYEILHGPCR